MPEHDIRISWQGLDRDNIDDLHDFLRSQSDVDHLYSRVQTMDAAFDPSKIVTPAVVGFAVGIGNAVTKPALDVVYELVKEWAKRRAFPEKSDALVKIYGPGGDIIKEVPVRPKKVKK